TNDLVIPFTEDFRALNIFINNFRLNSHPLTPNFWLIQSLRSLALHSYGYFILYVSAILTTSFLALAILYFLADKWYFEVWRLSMERSAANRREIVTINPLLRLIGKILSSSGQGYAIWVRDIKILLRQRGQWTQMAVMLALVT